MAKHMSAVEEVLDESSGKIYQAPCQGKCPLDISIQRNHIRVALLSPDPKVAEAGMLEIGKEVYEQSPLFPLLCAYVCGLCETECNYKDQTGAVRRRMIMRPVAKAYVDRYLPSAPAMPAPTKDKVAIIGGGPGGLMCAYELAKRGYKPTIFEKKQELGGALRYIPLYRLPRELMDTVIHNLLRIAHVEARLGVGIGEDGKGLDALKKEGYKAVFVASGTPVPRPLTFGREMVSGTDVEGVSMGLNLLYEANQGLVDPKLYKGKKVLVIGGGNVAFDAARTARRLNAKKVTVLCLEGPDKAVKGGIPADVEEIEGAEEEGIKIIYSRGVAEVISKGGKFKAIKCPKCTAVFDDEDRFNPQFNTEDVETVKGDVLLVTIGQGPERPLYQSLGLLNKDGRLDLDNVTLMSNVQKGLFVGGDARRIGFASEAMRDGAAVAESIDRYIQGKDLAADRERETEKAPIPEGGIYKAQPELKWVKAKKRVKDFSPFEEDSPLEDVLREARRCLCCGPCLTCKGCVEMGLRDDIPDIEVIEEMCSGCGICVTVCPYNAAQLKKNDDDSIVSIIDLNQCKRCGACVSVCPSQARVIKDDMMERVDKALAAL